MTNELEGTKEQGRVRILKATLYQSHMIYIRMIGTDYFEYLLEYNGEIYSSYIIIKPTKGKKILTEDQIAECRDLIYAGAEATLDELLGIDTLSKEQREYAELLEENRKKIEENLKEENGKK